MSAIGSPADQDQSAWLQRLYPVVGGDGGLRGVVTRRELFRASTVGDVTAPVAQLMHRPVVVTHADQTLRHVASAMAVAEVSTIPVVDRDDPARVVGVVSLEQLLAGRARDHAEARERERVLRVRMVRPAWSRRSPV